MLTYAKGSLGIFGTMTQLGLRAYTMGGLRAAWILARAGISDAAVFETFCRVC